MEPASYDVIVIKFTVVASFPCVYLLEIDRDLRLLRGCSRAFIDPPIYLLGHGSRTPLFYGAKPSAKSRLR